MAAKDGEILDAHDATDITAIAFFNMRENGHLHIGLLDDFWRTLDNLHCQFFA